MAMHVEGWEGGVGGAGVQAWGAPQAARRHQGGFPVRASFREAGFKPEAMHACCVPT